MTVRPELFNSMGPSSSGVMENALSKDASSTGSEKVNVSRSVSTSTEPAAGSENSSAGGVESGGPPVGGTGTAQAETKVTIGSTCHHFAGECAFGAMCSSSIIAAPASQVEKQVRAHRTGTKQDDGLGSSHEA